MDNVYELATYIPRLLVECGLVKSRSQARRLIAQGAVKIITEDEVLTVPEGCYYGEIHDGDILKVGRNL